MREKDLPMFKYFRFPTASWICALIRVEENKKLKKMCASDLKYISEEDTEEIRKIVKQKRDEYFAK